MIKQSLKVIALATICIALNLVALADKTLIGMLFWIDTLLGWILGWEIGKLLSKLENKNKKG